jgi:hypothetical protein
MHFARQPFTRGQRGGEQPPCGVARAPNWYGKESQDMCTRACLAPAAAVALLLLAATAYSQANLVANGNFEGGFPIVLNPNPLDGAANDGIPTAWTRVETFSGGVPEGSLLNGFNFNGPSAPGLWCLGASRNGGGVSGDWTAVEQPLAINALGCASLALSIDVRVDYHNLVAGGFVTPAFEWPVILQIDYLDTGGNAQTWRFGWYLTNPGDGPPGPVSDPGQGLIPFYNDLAVPGALWVANTFNLKTELPQAVTITNLRVGGSGWDFEGFVDNVVLQCEPIQVPSLTAAGLAVLAGLIAMAGVWMAYRRGLA